MSDMIQTLRKGGVGVRDLANLTMGIEKAVVLSIQNRPQREGGVTEHEMKRRAKWCVDTALMLMRDYQWSSERVCDTLPEALVTYLDTGDFIPSPHRSWVQRGVEA